MKTQMTGNTNKGKRFLVVANNNNCPTVPAGMTRVFTARGEDLVKTHLLGHFVKTGYVHALVD